MENIMNRLAEWKEKILFGIVLLVTLTIVLKAEPFGGGVADIDAEARTSAITAAGIDQATAQKVLSRLENPGEYTPGKPEEAVINRPFFSERDAFEPSGPSAWMLTQESYESLPPLQLTVPGFSELPDYDIAAGPRPELALTRGLVPRDNRPVNLTSSDE